MALKNIFSYGGGKRKVGHSKFKQTVNSLGSANFGSLDCAMEPFETIPDDYIWAQQNTLTKVKPMVSPAFTRIHQNWYAFYVRNQQVWKYWNDYITNGTAYSQVYGSNLTNQQNQNIWEPPSIPANYLQLICKMATGFALPVYRGYMTHSAFELAFGLKSSDYKFSNVDHNSDRDLFIRNRVTDFVALVFSKFPAFSSIPYFEAYTSSSVIYFEFAGSHDQLKPLFNILTIDPIDPNIPPSGIIGKDTQAQKTNVMAEQFSPVMFRFFSDNASSDVDYFNSPFVLSRKVVHSNYNNLDLNNFHFDKRHDLDNFITSNINADPSGNGRQYVLIRSRFWGVSYQVRYFNASNDLSFHNYNRDSSTDFYWTLNGSWLGLSSGIKSSEEIYNVLSTVPSFLGVTTDNWYDLLDWRQDIPTSSHPWGSPIEAAQWQTPFDQFTLRQHKSVATATEYLTIGLNLPCDIVIPVLHQGDIWYTDTYYDPQMITGIQSSSSDSLGYFSIDWMIYLCKQVFRHLDNMRIPIDGLTVRRFTDYRYERINALPFFGYSNIWENYFRNSAVSTPEFDYSETNGPALQSPAMIGAFNVGGSISHAPSWMHKYSTLSEFPTNSWVIPFTTIPKNGLSRESITTGNLSHFINGQNHYFTIYDYSDLFSLLTGYGIHVKTILQMYYQYTIAVKPQIGSDLDYITFSDLFSTNFYLPNYYNGLLHLKYQNFNKDYYSSAMLDPMSGANQVELGDTINELRVNETKQSWFEMIAQARSVKAFFNAIFGVTPIECDDKARLMGTDHVDINIGEVVQTSQTDQTPQGTRTGLGQAKGQGGLIKGHCNEHGFVFIIRSHTIEAQYFQGLSKMWIPKDSYMDYPTVDFAHIGNESILQKELNYNTVTSVNFKNYIYKVSDLLIDPPSDIYSSTNINRYGSGVQKYDGVGNPVFANHTHNTFTLTKNIVQSAGTCLDNVFGYSPRYSTYKFKNDELHGEMRNKLKQWQTFRKFFTQPILSHEFVNWELLADSEELNKIFAVTSDDVEDKFILDSFINIIVDRALPYVCVPHSR